MKTRHAVWGSLFLPLNAMAAGTELAKGSSALGAHDMLRLTFGLLIVVLLIVALAWVLRRLNQAGIGVSGAFRIIAGTSLGPREKIMLVKAGERYLLLGVANGSINTLHDFGEEMPPGFQVEAKNSFPELLKHVMRKS